ncbi:MAG: efflux RND transporter periplasmic adaptor subunit [Anaerolineae bacterium]
MSQNAPNAAAMPSGAAEGAAQPGAGARPNTAPKPQAKSRGRGWLRLLIVLIVLLGLAAVAGSFGLRYYQDQQMYVSTDNALVTGALVQVGGLNAGRVSQIGADIGDAVQKNQVVANISVPSSVGTMPNGQPRLDYRGTDDMQVPVRAPMDGVVVARSANPGDTVTAGQSLLTIIDPSQLWVNAQIEETKVGRLKVGQPVEVSVDTLDRVLPGKVAAIGRASAATFSLIPSTNTSGNFTKVTQLVPVKITVDYGQLPLTLGSSVEVKIRTQE